MEPKKYIGLKKKKTPTNWHALKKKKNICVFFLKYNTVCVGMTCVSDHV